MDARAAPLLAFALLLPLSGCLDDAGTVPSGPAPAPPGTVVAGSRTWAPLEAATIRPGVQMRSPGGQCTSNFVFTSPDNQTVYLGFAAHCVAGTEDPTKTNGCDPATLPMALGTNVTIQGASLPGRLAYTSWATMQASNETDADACAYNDFAVVALDPADASKANPAMRHFGGPTALASAGQLEVGDRILTYGRSGLRPQQSPDQVNWHEGYVTEAGAAGGWSTETYTLSPGVPGDSGSGVLSADGQALGNLVTLGVTPHPLSNNFSSLDKELEYAREKAGLDLRLATAPLLDGGMLPPLP